MGEVYRARDTKLRRLVALKVIHAEHQENGLTQGIVSRFTREAQAAAALSHPNVVTVFDVGEVDGSPFIAMELLEGSTLRTQIHRSASIARRLQWLLEMARALAAAHAHGLIHRDIKPDNVMIASGHVKVLDFGIAKWTDDENLEAAPKSEGPVPSSRHARTKTGHHVGTPRYMAPEQSRGRTVDGRVDQFAWGIVAYELCSRVHPQERAPGFSRDEDWAAPPVPLAELTPELPFGVSAIVMKTLRRWPEERFDKMDDVVAALSPIATRALANENEADEHVTADEVPTEREEKRKPRARRSAIAIAGSLIALVVLLGGLEKRARDALVREDAAKPFKVDVTLAPLSEDDDSRDIAKVLAGRVPQVAACWQQHGVEVLRDVPEGTEHILLSIEPDGRVAAAHPYGVAPLSIVEAQVDLCIERELLGMHMLPSDRDRAIPIRMTVKPVGRPPPRPNASIVPSRAIDAAVEAPLKEGDPSIELVPRYSEIAATQYDEKQIDDTLATISDGLIACNGRNDWSTQIRGGGVSFGAKLDHDATGAIHKAVLSANHLSVSFNECIRHVFLTLKSFPRPRESKAGTVTVTIRIAVTRRAR